MSSDPIAEQPSPYGVLICGHGSRNRLAVEEFERLATGLRQRMSPIPVEHGFLEFASPILRDGLDRLRERGVNKVLAIPAMLFAAGHAKNDIPSVLNTYSAETGLQIDYGRELGVDRLMIAAAGARIQEALETDQEVPLSETMLVVVGRGSSDPDANSNVAKVTRMLVEGLVSAGAKPFIQESPFLWLSQDCGIWCVWASSGSSFSLISFFWRSRHQDSPAQ